MMDLVNPRNGKTLIQLSSYSVKLCVSLLNIFFRKILICQQSIHMHMAKHYQCGQSSLHNSDLPSCSKCLSAMSLAL